VRLKIPTLWPTIQLMQQNGNYYAAIQIISELEGINFDSWDGIVGDVEYLFYQAGRGMIQAGW